MNKGGMNHPWRKQVEAKFAKRKTSEKRRATQNNLKTKNYKEGTAFLPEAGIPWISRGDSQTKRIKGQ